jgi:hypothetical protein
VWTCSIFFLILTLTSATGFGQATRADPSRRADVYAIYSLMLANPQTSHGSDDNEIYLIADTTLPGVPEIPCVRPPSGEESRFAEVMTDFDQRKNTPVRLEPAFQITKPFRLMNRDEVAGFERRRFSLLPPDSNLKATDLFRLTDVYFSRDRSLALTAISTWCGGLCSLYQWKVFERSKEGTWEEKNWVACITVAWRFRRNWKPDS